MNEAVSLDEIRLLSRVDLFSGLDRVQLAQLASDLEKVRTVSGSAVVTQGEPGDALYVVIEGDLDVVVQDAGSGRETRVNRLGLGDYFGEMSLLTDSPRSATVRSRRDSLLLRLDRRTFNEVLQQRPAVARDIIRTLSDRLRRSETNRSASEATIEEMLQGLLDALPPERRARVLEAALLPHPTPPLLTAIFGVGAQTVQQDLLEVTTFGDYSTPGIIAALRQHAQRQLGEEQAVTRAEHMAGRLAAAHYWTEALDLLTACGARAQYVSTLGQAVRDTPPLSPEEARRWVDRLSDGEAAQDIELLLLRRELHRERGDEGAATALIRRALANAQRMGSAMPDPRLTALAAEMTAEPEAETATQRPGLVRLRGRLLGLGGKLVLLGVAAALTVAAVVFGHGRPDIAFLLLLGAAIMLWVGEIAADSFVALALLAAWLLLRVVKPSEALAGYGSTQWLFVACVLLLAIAVVRSGLLFRAGLLLIRRMPRNLFGQATFLCLTGVLISPLIPTGKTSTTMLFPITMSLADALGLEDRDPRAAVLGLSAWIGATPMTFLFVNGATTNLLAWSLLPAAEQARFNWIYWVFAALPLGLVAVFGSIGALFLMFRPGKVSLPPKEKLNLQMAVLGPPDKREIAMLVVLLLTVAGWIAAGPLKIDVGVVAILGVLAAVASGNLDQKNLKDLDWNFLLFNGAALSIGSVAVIVGLDKSAGGLLRSALSFAHGSQVLFILFILAVSLVAQLALSKGTAVLLMSLILLPVAPTFGIHPWVVTIIMLATASMWFYRAQTSSYALALSLTQERLFSDSQGRRACFAFVGVLVVGLLVSLPYWHLLGLL